MIRKYSLIILEKTLNQGLALDESMPAKLKALSGNVLKIIISPLNVYFFMQFAEEGIHLMADYSGEPNTVIHSSPVGLIRLSILPASKVRSLFNDSIRISGDVELGQQVKKLFDEIDIDWEGHLARFTGDVVAYQVGSFVRQGITFQQQLRQSVRQNVTEYLQEELRLFPTPEEMNDFFNDVDDLSLSVARLEAYINQLGTI